MTTDPVRIALGRRLKAAREGKELTQEQVADRFGLKKGTVSAWEKGRGVPDSLRLVELARLYDSTPDALLIGSPLSRQALQLATQFDAYSPAERARLMRVWNALFEESSSAGKSIPQTGGER